MKKILALLLCAVFLLDMLPAKAAQEEKTILIACSDFQNFDDSDDGDYSGEYTENLALMGKTINAMGFSSLDGFFFGGDYNFSDTSSSRTKTGTGLTAIRTFIQSIYPTLDDSRFVMLQGNHDAKETAGMAETGAYEFDKYSVYAINEDDYMDSNSSHTTIRETGQALEEYLKEKAEMRYDRPVFVLSHLPLHFNTRTQRRGDAKYAHELFDPLNKYGSLLNIIFLFGHNHARGYDSYLGGSSIFLKRGDTINVAVDGSETEYTNETLNFTYMNYGYIGYFWFNYDSDGEDIVTENPPADNTLTMTSFEIEGNTVTISRWDENGLHNLKSEGQKITTELNDLSYYDEWPADKRTYGPVEIVYAPMSSDLSDKSDLTMLNAAIKNAQGFDAECYTVESWNDFIYALELAKTMTDSDKQEDIDSAVAAIEIAMMNLIPYAAVVEEAIKNIGTITLESKGTIETVRAAYDALPEAQKSSVTNYAVLQKAEEDYRILVAIDTVEKQIGSIGSATLESGDTIAAARTAYDALPEAQKSSVTNYAVLQKAEEDYRMLIAVDTVEKQIDSIGTVTLESGNILAAVRAAYDTLPEAQKSSVTNYAVLQEAEEGYRILVEVDAVEKQIDSIGTVTLESGNILAAVRATYDALPEARKSSVTNYAVLQEAEEGYRILIAIDAVEKQISSIGIVTLESGNTIVAVRAAYDALPEARKSRVTNYAVLQEAEEDYRILIAVNTVEKQIDSIGTVTLGSGDTIAAVRAAYDALPEARKSRVTNYSALEKAEEAYRTLHEVKMVEELIDSIGTVALGSKTLIERAQTAFEALPSENRELVMNARLLFEAEQTLERLESDAALDCHGNPEICVSSQFEDIPPYSNWAHIGIDYCIGKGLFTGTGTRTFSPKITMTRAMLVTVLWRYSGRPKAGENPFMDVPNGQWFSEAVAWASSEGIVTGTGNGRFCPDNQVTREQLAAILFRYDGAQKEEKIDLSDYPDAAVVSAYAEIPISWALSEGILTGSASDGERYLLPRSGATREQVAAMLMRYMMTK